MLVRGGAARAVGVAAASRASACVARRVLSSAAASAGAFEHHHVHDSKLREVYQPPSSARIHGALTLGPTQWPLARSALLPPPASRPPALPFFVRAATVGSTDQYAYMYARSLSDPDDFWGKIAATYHWHKKVREGSGTGERKAGERS
jgi:hypothetical protein